MSSALAIDQSTSATKALIFSRRGELLAKASRPHKQIYPQPGWVEHDAEEIWRNTLEVIRDVISQHPAAAEDLGWLSIANQRETIVVFDRDSGRPLQNAIVWLCRRGDSICARLRREGHDALATEATGLKIDGYFSASKLRWLVESKPEIAARLRDGSALIGTIDAYLIYRLTHGGVFATDHTNASRTLLYNIHLRQWDRRLCDLFRVPINSLPEIRDSNGQFGLVANEDALAKGLPICGVAGDSQASLFALGCRNPGQAKVTFGTGSSLLLNVGPSSDTESEDVVTTLAWVLDGNPTYCLEGIINYAAATIEWLKDQLQLLADPAETESLARSVDDNGGVYLVPAFAGLSAPYWNSDARAAVIGLSAHSSRAHVVRAALESIAYQVCDVLELMKQATGATPAQISVDGGATTNEFLMQFTADIAGVELQVSQVAEASPLGAALCGALGQGEYTSVDALIAPAATGKTYGPRMPPVEAAKFYEGWKRAVQRVL